MTPLLRIALAAAGIAAAALGTVRWSALHTAHAAERLREAGELDRAAALAESAHARWPHPAAAAHTRASIAAQRRDLAATETWLAACEGTLPSRVDVLRLRAAAAQMRGDLPALERELSAALRLDPTSPAADWEGLARLRETLGFPADEVEAARRAAQQGG